MTRQAPHDPVPVFVEGDYVVRFGWRGFATMLACLLGWSAFAVYVFVRSDGTLIRLVAVVGEIGLLIAALRDLAKARRREVMFAVHRSGVYFGSNEYHEDVPWSTVCAVELYDERRPSGRSQQVTHCVGVRAAGVSAVSRVGNPPSAGPVPRTSMRYYEDAGRRDLVPGTDGTVRWTCRQMNGWRIDRRRLEEAVHRYSPSVPVIDGEDWPPALSVSEAQAAARARRIRGRER